jgi:hypothetical protein
MRIEEQFVTCVRLFIYIRRPTDYFVGVLDQIRHWIRDLEENYFFLVVNFISELFWPCLRLANICDM